VGRFFVQELFRWQRETAQLRGVNVGRARSGAVQFPQRFGGSLNLNVHYHVVLTDGVFVLEPGSERADFHPLPGPAAIDLETIAVNVEIRTKRWLKRQGLLVEPNADDGFNNEQPERSALDAFLLGSLGVGELTKLPLERTTAEPLPEQVELPRPTKSARRGGHYRGFDIHAGVWVAANDRAGRERLFRYCARPALSLERLRQLPDGRIAYALRKPWGNETHRVMDPLQFLARLAAIVPPPRHPLVRFHGVFAPQSFWRSKVVPEPPPAQRTSNEEKSGAHGLASCPGCRAGGAEHPECQKGDTRQTREGPLELVAPTASGAQPGAPTLSAPGGALAIENTTPVADGAESQAPHAAPGPQHSAPAALRPSARIPWAELLRRVYDIDALSCPCGGRLRFISVITEREVARDFLDSVGLPSAPPPSRAPGRPTSSTLIPTTGSPALGFCQSPDSPATRGGQRRRVLWIRSR